MTCLTFVLSPADLEDSSTKAWQQSFALLLVAASAIVWLKPLYLEIIVSNLESELLKIERLAQHYSTQGFAEQS